MSLVRFLGRVVAVWLCWGVLLSPSVWAGGPWLPGPGHGFLKLDQRVIRANRFYNPDGEVIPITTTSVYISSVYGELGLSERWSLEGYLPLFFRTTLNTVTFRQSGRTETGDALNGLGDLQLGLRYGLLTEGPLVLSAALTLGIPTGNPGGGQTGLLQTGDGEFNQLLKLDVGYSFYPRPVYVAAGLGFNNRTDNFSDEWHASFEAGYTTGALTASWKMYLVQSTFNGQGPVAANGIFSNNTEYLTYGPEVAYQLTPRLGLSAGVGFATAGRNILAEPAWQLGVFARW